MAISRAEIRRRIRAEESGSRAKAKRPSFTVIGAPKGTRVVYVTVPVKIFGRWKLRLEYPGEKPLTNTADIYCGRDRRIKVAWKDNYGTGVNRAFTDAVDLELRRRGARCTT